MIKNHLKIAWRNITTRKFYTFINISGLALAISCCLLIYLYASYNLSFDDYHPHSKATFRLVNELHLKNIEYDKGSSFREFTEVKTGIPQVLESAFSVDGQSFIIEVNNNDLKRRFKEENNVSFANSDWFRVFSHKWLEGGPGDLDQPNNAVLIKKTARKFFGDADPIGQILVINKQPIKVAGVIDDAPYNTDLKSDIYLSFSSYSALSPLYDSSFSTDWGYINSKNNAFIVLNNAGQKDAVEKQIVELEKRKWGKDMPNIFKFKLLPLNEVHFDTRYGGVVQKSMLWTLAIIGLLIIAIAIFNYINLTVAQQSRRAAEIATRKVLGGSASQIFMQFIVESMMTTAMAVIVAVVLVLAILPAANTFIFVNGPVYIISYSSFYLFIVVVLACLTIGTAVYPASLLSRVSISKILKNNMFSLPAGPGRKIMVVFQNAVTQSLIVCTLIILMQVHYLKNTDIGFDRKMVITIPIGITSESQREQFSQSLKSIPAVKSFSICFKPPSSDSRLGATVKFGSDWEKWPARFAIGDSGYCHTFGLHILAGRNIRNSQPVPEFLINKTMAVMLMGRHIENVIGTKLAAGDVNGLIVGVVQDFNVKSLAEPIEPSVLLEDKNWQNSLAVKLSGSRTFAAIDKLQAAYKRILPDQLFSYQFVDGQIARLYKGQEIQQRLIFIGASIAIIISSLGLLGLSALVALQRTKEIGIRRVFGATVTQVVVLLSNDFVWMVLLAFIIAVPVSWWAMNKWLQSFAYRIHAYWWVFALAGIISILIAVAVVCIRSIKVAVANPVDSLRSE